MGAALVLSVALLYVGSGVAIQVLFEELDFEKPFFFSYVSVSLCSVHLLQYFYLQGRRSWRRRESSNYRQLEQLDTVEQTHEAILAEFLPGGVDPETDALLVERMSRLPGARYALGLVLGSPVFQQQ